MFGGIVGRHWPCMRLKNHPGKPLSAAALGRLPQKPANFRMNP
jgi:hypothetical protein